jgi:Zn-dependent peptidase ImmA (M78 family)
MKQISRFDLADFNSPDRIVHEIIRRIPDLPIPVPIEELAQMLDIISIEALTTEGFEGGLLTDIEKSEGFILVNMNSPPRRRRFTVGHELCHFLAPTHKPTGDQFLCSADDMYLSFARKEDPAVRMEVEANRFSARILMPEPHFRRDLRLRKGVEIEHILSLAEKYDTSKEATARRYVDVQDEPCAIVVSHNGHILRFYRHEDFPFIDIERGDPVPNGSLTAKIHLTVGVPSNSEEMEGGLWLSGYRDHRIPMIYEQVLPQSDGYRLTLLSLAEDLEDLEEEEELETSWTPRFKR